MSATHPTKLRRNWLLLASILVVIGMACSAYLLYRHFALDSGQPGQFDICASVFGMGCDSAVRSELATQFGIPLAGWGIIQFSMTAAALVLAVALGSAFRTEGAICALLFCAVGALSGIVLTVLMFSGRAAVCPLCLIVHLVNVGLLPTIVMATCLTRQQLTESLRGGLRYVGGGTLADPFMTKWKLMGLLNVALVGVVAYQWVLIQTDRQIDESDTPLTIDQLVEEFESGQQMKIALDDSAPRLGSASDPYQLVLFSDFQCPSCRRFADIVAETRERHPEVSVAFVHYPLSKDCNPALRSNFHPRSCGAAYAAEAAHRQGKFWKYHDALFATRDELDAEVLERIAAELGLDVPRFQEDMAAPSTEEKIKSDTALGKSLKILGTPSAFLNGKPLPVAAMGRFDQLIDELTEHTHD